MRGTAAVKLVEETVLHTTGGPEIVLLTPELANKLLERNTLNRPLSDAHVQRLATQIKAGKWRFNGDTIKLSYDEDVLDGQHRLWAVIEAKVAVKTAIIYGIDKDAFATIDTLRRPRSGGDVIALAGQTRHRKHIATALTWLLRYQREVIPDHRAPQHRIENSDIEQAYKTHPMIVRAVERASRTRTVANVPIMACLYYVITNRCDSIAEQMMRALENPVEFAVDHPFYHLRNYFLSDHHKSKDPIQTFALVIKAANATYRKQRLRALIWRSQGDRAEAFPTLEVRRD